MAATERSTQFAITIDQAERDELLTLIEREMRETHVEARRTEAPDYQKAVHHRESVLQGLLEKLRRD